MVYQVLAVIPEYSAESTEDVFALGNQHIPGVSVVGVLRHNHPEDYAAAANYIIENVNVVSIQHEFGLFSGEAEALLPCLLQLINKPVVTTFHTVTEVLGSVPESVLVQIHRLGTATIALSHIGELIMSNVYNVGNLDKLNFIPHGAESYKTIDNTKTKSQYGWDNKFVILSLGIHHRAKGFHVMISAMPAILKRVPNAIFVIAGQAGQSCGEGCDDYAKLLKDRIKSLHVEDHVVFVDRYLSDSEIYSIMHACDVYASLLTSDIVSSSGTVSRAIAAGRAVIATPFLYAKEVLSHGRGILVPFDNAEATAAAVIRLGTDSDVRVLMQRNAFEYSQKTMMWPSVVDRHITLFREFGQNGELP
ncbi:hypothetical protein BC830DRAFT_1172502 [Chytriomyces sp. MP71]|nr:hypothetical protein BC830DRAFT_1172502 [Chytriomyces sp. MP71]